MHSIRAPHRKGFQILAVDQLIARIPFSRFALAAMFVSLATAAADVPVSTLKQDKKTAFKSQIALKPETETVAKALASEQKTICRREFTESVAEALEKAKEQ